MNQSNNIATNTEEVINRLNWMNHTTDDTEFDCI